MKEYIKPSIEVLIVEAMDIILAESFDLSRYEEVGNPNNQGAPSRKGYREDNGEDNGDYGW